MTKSNNYVMCHKVMAGVNNYVMCRKVIGRRELFVFDWTYGRVLV